MHIILGNYMKKNNMFIILKKATIMNSGVHCSYNFIIYRLPN